MRFGSRRSCPRPPRPIRSASKFRPSCATVRVQGRPASDAARDDRRRGGAAQLFAVHRARRAGLDGHGQADRRRAVFQLGRRPTEARRHGRRDAAARQLHRPSSTRRQARHLVGIAGGSGITPVMSLIKTAAAAGAAQPLHFALRQPRQQLGHLPRSARGPQGQVSRPASSSTISSTPRSRTSSCSTACSTATAATRRSPSWCPTRPRSTAGSSAAPAR